MSTVGSASGAKRVKVKQPEPVDDAGLGSEDNDSDTKIKGLQVENKVTLSRTAKVATPPKFKGKLSKLKEFVTKAKIYLNYNSDSFEWEADKVTFVISYYKG